MDDTGQPPRVIARAGQSGLTLTLVPESLIVGRVKFPSTEAADHVQVRLYRREIRDGFGQWTPLTSVTTRSDGEFRFAELRAGEYKIFSLESLEQDPLANIPNGPVYGFPPRFFAAAGDFATADTIQLGAGAAVTANIAPERQRYYDVKIPVIAAQPADMGLQVSVFTSGHRGPGFELGYDRNDHAIKGSLPNGSYTVEASSSGPVAATGMTNITVSNGRLNAQPLALSPNPSIELNIHQDRTGAEDTATQPGDINRNQPGVLVMLVSAEEFNQRGPGMRYQAQGEPLTFAGVRPGRYWVQVQGGMGYAASVTSGGKDLLRTPLVVPFGTSIPPIDITVRYDTGTIEATVEGKSPPESSSGTISSSIGSRSAFMPEGGAYVYCLPASNDGGAANWFNSWSNGHFVLQNIPPGDYRILAFDTPQNLEYRNPVAMRPYESKGQVVHVTAGQKAQVTVQSIRSE